MVRLAGRYAGAVVALAAPGTAFAQQVETGVTVSAGLGVETNPYNEGGGSTAAGVATTEIVPKLRYRTETTTFDLQGSAQFRQFFSRYGLEDNYGVTSSIVSRQAENLTLRSTWAYSYNENGFGGFGRPSLSAGTPLVNTPDFVLPDVVAPIADVTILGQRTRVSALSGNAGLDTRLSQRTQLSFDVGGRTMRFKNRRGVGNGFAFSDYNAIDAQVRVSRSLDERTSVGLIGGFTKSDFLNTRIGDADTYSALVSLDTRFGTRWILSASAGFSRTTLQQNAGLPDVSFNALTVRGRGCSQGEFSQFCLNAQRSPQPTANGDVRIADSVGAEYTRRLSPVSQIGVSANYARTGRGRIPTAFAQPEVEFLSGTARYDRRLSDNMTFFTSASYAKFLNSTFPRKANVGLNVGIQVGFGALK